MNKTNFCKKFKSSYKFVTLKHQDVHGLCLHINLKPLYRAYLYVAYDICSVSLSPTVLTVIQHLRIKCIVAYDICSVSLSPTVLTVIQHLCIKCIVTLMLCCSASHVVQYM